MRGTEIVQPVDASRSEHVISLFSHALSGYPLLRHVLGDDDAGRRALLIRLFTMARVLLQEPMLGAWEDGKLVGAALASDPHGPPAPPAFWDTWTEVWERLGPDAEARYLRYAEVARTFAVDDPHVQLNLLGVRVSSRRQGIGRRLVDAVQDLSCGQPDSRGIALTTEDPANLPFYRRLGFEVIGRSRVAPGLETWGCFRANDR